MAQSRQLGHHVIDDTAVAYQANYNPIGKDDGNVVFVDGDNVLTSIYGYFEKRGGFGYLQSNTGFTFSGTVKSMFTWSRWTSTSVTLSGSYFAMWNDVTSTISRVYKQRFLNGVAQDYMPVLLYTDASSALPFDFLVSNDYVFFGNGNTMRKYDGTTLDIWGITKPSAAVTFTSAAGALSPTVGFQWVICWDSSTTGQVSSPSAPSSSTGAATTTKWTISGNTTTDTQVNRVRIFRTIDGGSIYFEHPSSPINYSTWTASGFEDNTADYSASTITGIGAPGSNVAPLPNQNNPPTASKSPVWFANRVWTCAGDTVYYSAFEELVRGIEEESFPSENLRAFGKEVNALVVAGDFLLIFTAADIFRIYGDKLANFAMDKLLSRKGASSTANVCALAYQNFEGVAWLDTSNTIWITNGTKQGTSEISQDIRNDISAIDQTQSALVYHETGTAHWLVLLDGAAGKLRVYNLDTQKWMPPWTFANGTALHSGMLSAANYKLYACKSAKPLVQGTSYQDAGVNIGMSATFSLVDVISETDPSGYGIMDHVAVVTNSATATTVKYITDEDPSGATYTTITNTIATPPLRSNGTNLVETWYSLRSSQSASSRRISLKLDWAEANSNPKVYEIDIAYEQVG